MTDDFQNLQKKLQEALIEIEQLRQENAHLKTVVTEPPPPACLTGYSLESAIAEKFQAMIKLDALNSRMKDFYDIWLLIRQFDFQNLELQKAIDFTLQNRETEIPEVITAFTDNFVQEKSTQWNAFIRKIHTENAPADFEEVIQQVRLFLEPASSGILTATKIDLQWKAPGPWK